MDKVFLVAVGGALGSVARYLLSGLVLHHLPEGRFPLGTFIVNVGGCLVAGLLGGLTVKHDFFSAHARIFLFSGILGGFTTFPRSASKRSTCCVAVRFRRRGGNVVASVLVGLLALWLGFGAISVRSQ